MHLQIFYVFLWWRVILYLCSQVLFFRLSWFCVVSCYVRVCLCRTHLTYSHFQYFIYTSFILHFPSLNSIRLSSLNHSSIYLFLLVTWHHWEIGLCIWLLLLACQLWNFKILYMPRSITLVTLPHSDFSVLTTVLVFLLFR